IAGTFQLQLDRYSIGAAYSNPRLFGEWLYTDLAASIIINRLSGQAEGSSGLFDYGKPLYSYDNQWAWSASVSWRDECTRRFKGGDLATYTATTTYGSVPWVCSTDVLFGDYHLIRSEGNAVKHDFYLGMFASRKVYHARPDQGTAFLDPT